MITFLVKAVTAREMHLIMIVPGETIGSMTWRLDDCDAHVCLERFRLVLVPDRPFQSAPRLCPMRDLIVGNRPIDELELAVRLEIRFDEVFPSCRGNDLGCAAFKELRDPTDVVEVAMCAYYVVLPPQSAIAGWVQRDVKIRLNRVLL